MPIVALVERFGDFEASLLAPPFAGLVHQQLRCARHPPGGAREQPALFDTLQCDRKYLTSGFCNQFWDESLTLVSRCLEDIL